jgi:hypothetical protein
MTKPLPKQDFMQKQLLWNPINKIRILRLGLLCIICGITTIANYAQTATTKDSMRTTANLKSGNSQDVLISFFQLAFKDITGKNKSFLFQSSLFGIKAKIDSTLLTKRNYLKEKFARNFVLSVSPTLDENYKFKSNTIGVKYAIFNNRDKSVFNYFTPTNTAFNIIKSAALNGYKKRYNLDLKDTNFKLANHFFYDDDNDKRTEVEKLPKEFRILLDSLIKASKFKKIPLARFRDTMNNEFTTLSQYVENRGLWTISSNFSTDNNGKLFSAINFNSEYLKGMRKNNARSNIELNLNANFDFTDDTSSIAKKDLDRKVFSFSGGFNWIIAKNKNNKSIIELKGAIAYNNILSRAYFGEKTSVFTAEGTFRIRITDNIWLPFDIKYDPNQGNVFGFLSIKTNFDALKGK